MPQSWKKAKGSSGYRNPRTSKPRGAKPVASEGIDRAKARPQPDQNGNLPEAKNYNHKPTPSGDSIRPFHSPDFPQLRSSSTPTKTKATFAGKLNLVKKVNKPETIAFTMVSEDFPALPGTSSPPSNWTSANSSPVSSYLEDDLLTDGSSGCSPAVPTKPPDLLTSSSTFLPITKETQQSKQSSQTGQDQTSNPPVITDEYGLLGLLALIKATGRDCNPHIFNDVDLEAEAIIQNHDGIFADTPSSRPLLIDSHVPSEYFSNSNTRGKLPDFTSCANLNEDLFFFIFYTRPGEVWQLKAAKELFIRNWRYHKVEKVWISRVPGVVPTEKTDTCEKGTYFYFDIKTWRKTLKEYILFYENLEGKLPFSVNDQESNILGRRFAVDGPTPAYKLSGSEWPNKATCNQQDETDKKLKKLLEIVELGKDRSRAAVSSSSRLPYVKCLTSKVDSQKVIHHCVKHPPPCLKEIQQTTQPISRTAQPISRTIQPTSKTTLTQTDLPNVDSSYVGQKSCQIRPPGVHYYNLKQRQTGFPVATQFNPSFGGFLHQNQNSQDQNGNTLKANPTHDCSFLPPMVAQPQLRMVPGFSKVSHCSTMATQVRPSVFQPVQFQCGGDMTSQLSSGGQIEVEQHAVLPMAVQNQQNFFQGGEVSFPVPHPHFPLNAAFSFGFVDLQNLFPSFVAVPQMANNFFKPVTEYRLEPPTFPSQTSEEVSQKNGFQVTTFNGAGCDQLTQDVGQEQSFKNHQFGLYQSSGHDDGTAAACQTETNQLKSQFWFPGQFQQI